MKIVICFGTRPEAIKMAPLYHELKRQKVNVALCITAQHREMLDQVLDFFEIIPDYDLDLMKPNQSLNDLSANILFTIDKVFEDAKPNLVLVHGDTTTAAMIALASFHLGIKVGHVEAGLRTYNKKAPYPEEINRQMISRIADFHFTPTKIATKNLLEEGLSKDSIILTGNTVIDALLWTRNKINDINYLNPEIEALKKEIPKNKKIILVTGHRRENFGNGINNLCDALLSISKKSDVLIIYPVHLNPKVKDIVYFKLANIRNIYLISPVSYPVFVWLMQQAVLIITDSGGIQEEAPSLGKPVIVTRTVSERPEGVQAGFSTLVGIDAKKIVEKAEDFLEEFKGFENLVNPYGDGKASLRIVSYIKKIDMDDIDSAPEEV